MKRRSNSKIAGLAALAFGLTLLVGCGDDDFSPVSRNRGYDYAYTSTKGLSETPCNEVREGREAVIGRDKDRYECRFDRTDSIYIWVGEYDTLTAEGREFSRPESSSSSDEESSDSDESSSDSRSSSSRNSSSSYSSSYSSSSARSSSSIRSSSSYPYSGISCEGFLDTLESNEVFFNPDIDYGTMTDPRDGKTYRTVNVNGKTWMAQNLNFIDSVHYPLSKKYSLCNQDNEKNCDLLGRLYERAGAMNDNRCVYGSRCNLGSTLVQGICPDGWHIPSETEMQSLVDFVGNDNVTKVMSANGWGNDCTGRIKGEDVYGLSFVGAGSWNSEDGYRSKGLYAHAWVYANTTTQSYLLIRGREGEMYVNTYSDYELYYPVRCVKGNGVVPSSSSVSSSSMSSSSMSSSSVNSSSSVSSSSVSSSSVSSSSAKSSSSVSSSSMSSSSEEESSSSFNKTVLFNSSVSYGEMTDSRDGKTYRTIVVDGKTWMAENLNFADSSTHPLLEGNNRCYDDDPGECTVFGRLYSREAALNDSRCTCHNEACPSTSGTAQGVCPDGWHIPSKSEAEQLVNKAGGNQSSKRLNSSYGWDAGKAGTNEIGTSFTGTGAYRRENGDSKFSGKGSYTNIWIFDVSNPKDLDYLMVLGSGLVMFANEGESDPFFPIRCVKN